jgi:prepilin-type N-terminal cleavage/methylation domain-containing protein
MKDEGRAENQEHREATPALIHPSSLVLHPSTGETHMLLKTRRRAGITLIEILVVIAIISILVSLLMAGVQKARIAGKRTENGVRINEIGEAVTRCKSDLKLRYIPAWTAGFRLKSAYTTADPELAILTTAFPNLDYTNTGLPTATLDANQTLCFFLTGGAVTNFSGFSNNPRYPFTPGAAGESRKGPWVQNNQKFFSLNPPGLTPNGHPWLVDVYGLPFAYFASVDGKPNNYTTTAFGAQSYAGTSPYVGASGRFVNENGFQIISAGTDKTFGPGGTNVPATGSPGGEDDQANFSKTLLGGGIN